MDIGLSGGGGGGGFDPNSVANYWDEWVGDSIGGNDGDAIASWTGRGGRVLGVSTGTNRPVKKTAIVNGHAVARFASASSQWLSLATPAVIGHSGSMSLFVVVKCATTAANMAALATRYGATGWLLRLSSGGSGTLFAHLGKSPNATDTVTTTNWNIIELTRAT